MTVNDVDLAGCEAACVNDASCKSIDFYEGRTGHTCSVSYSDFADVGSTTGTTDCRFYEIDRAGTRAEQEQWTATVFFEAHGR